MKEPRPIVDKNYLLEKFEGKGGWVYTIIPEIAPDPHARFGWVRVRGSIDGVEISDYHLMPFLAGTGQLFLPIKAEIRKKIKKGAGDTVHVILYRDDELPEVPEEFLLCLRDDTEALRYFESLTEGEKHQYVRWIYSARGEQTKIDRMARVVATLAWHKKFAEL
jgi:hypothetical protein